MFNKENVKLYAKEGNYLVGMTIRNPYTYRNYYLVKIGKSTNILKRLKQYFTYNPALWIIDTIYYNDISCSEIEEYFLDMLDTLPSGKETLENFSSKHNKEWFEITREHYLLICQYGFDALDVLLSLGGYDNTTTSEWKKLIKEYVDK